MTFHDDETFRDDDVPDRDESVHGDSIVPAGEARASDARPAAAADIRYRVGLLAIEEDASGTWVAPIPDGPIVRVDGIGPLILELLSAHAEGCTLAGLTAAVRQAVPDAPDAAEAEALVGAFLEQLASLHVIETL